MAIETVDSYPQKRLSINTHLGLKFLCFPHGKRMFPPWETYVSRMENIRFSNGKHKKHFLMMHNSTKHFPETLQSSHSSCNKSRIFFPSQNAVRMQISITVTYHTLIFNQYSQLRNRGIYVNLRYTNKQIKESRDNRLDYN